MKTIAVSIDEETLIALDDLARRRQRGRSRAAGSRPRASRSHLVRMALHEFLERQERTDREAHERQVLAEHRDVLARQAAALVAEQADR